MLCYCANQRSRRLCHDRLVDGVGARRQAALRKRPAVLRAAALARPGPDAWSAPEVEHKPFSGVRVLALAALASTSEVLGPRRVATRTEGAGRAVHVTTGFVWSDGVLLKQRLITNHDLQRSSNQQEDLRVGHRTKLSLNKLLRGPQGSSWTAG